MRLLTCLLLLSFSSALMAKQGYECSEGNNCEIKKNAAGKREGVETCKDTTGVIRRKASYKNDMLDGLWECFSEKSVLKESREYKADKLNGLTKRLVTDVNKYEETRYKDDELDGKSMMYNSSFSGGKYTLTETVITEYKKGNKEGFQIFLDKDGKETRRLCYKNDDIQRDKPELCGGEPIKAEKPQEQKESPNKGMKTVNFKSGKLKAKFLLLGPGDYEEYESFYENGQANAKFKRITKAQDFNSPDVYSYIAHDSNGKVLGEGTCNFYATDEFSEDCYRLNGKTHAYDESGEVVSEASFVNGKREGDSISYDREKGLETTVTFKKNVKTQMVQTKIGDKKVLKKEEYFSDGSVKK